MFWIHVTSLLFHMLLHFFQLLPLIVHLNIFNVILSHKFET